MKFQFLALLMTLLLSVSSWAIRQDRFDLHSKGSFKYDVELKKTGASYEVIIYSVDKGSREVIYSSTFVKKTPGAGADVYKDSRFQLMVNKNGPNDSYNFTLNNGEIIKGELEF